MNATEVTSLLQNDLLPAFLKERRRFDRIDRWARWDHDKPHVPRTTATPEYRELVARSQVPYLRLVVNAIVQGLYVDGYRHADAPDDADAWHYWQVNGMDKRQIPIHRAALTYGVAYEIVLPGETHLGERIPVMRGHSPRRMMAFYDDPLVDDWPEYALLADPISAKRSSGWNLTLYDDTSAYTLRSDAGGGSIEYLDDELHEVGICPVVRFANNDLEDRSEGEIEPLIPLQGRIDQTVFDRLVVQRFASWVVRTIAGMEAPPEIKDKDNPTPTELAAAKMRLKVEDILVAADPDTKFGSLPATPLDGFIAAHDSDLKDLIACSQTAPHYLLGQLVNLSAEALTAAETGAKRKKLEIQTSFGETHEQSLRLGAFAMGDLTAADDMSAQVRWRNTDSRSIAQVADAFVKFEQAGIPLAMLIEQFPDWTQQDVERAKDLIAHAQGVGQLVQMLQQQPAPGSPAPVPAPAPAPVPVPAAG